MIKWTLILMLIAALTGITGFSRGGSAMAGLARVVFFIAIAVLLVAWAQTIFEID